MDAKDDLVAVGKASTRATSPRCSSTSPELLQPTQRGSFVAASPLAPWDAWMWWGVGVVVPTCAATSTPTPGSPCSATAGRSAAAVTRSPDLRHLPAWASVGVFVEARAELR